jgi:hypothetical protein
MMANIDPQACESVDSFHSLRCSVFLRSADLIILRYFVLNSLFLYTTSIAYSSTCAIVEYLGIYLDPNATEPTSTRFCTTIGLLIMFFLLLIYFLLDRFVYEHEFRSIWTPYLFVAYVFICPPLRQVALLETDATSNRFNSALLWMLFGSAVLMMCLRLYRRLMVKCKASKKKTRISSQIEEITS